MPSLQHRSNSSRWQEHGRCSITHITKEVTHPRKHRCRDTSKLHQPTHTHTDPRITVHTTHMQAQIRGWAGAPLHMAVKYCCGHPSLACCCADWQHDMQPMLCKTAAACYATLQHCNSMLCKTAAACCAKQQQHAAQDCSSTRFRGSLSFQAAHTAPLAGAIQSPKLP